MILAVCFGRRRSPPVLSPRVRGADGALFEKLDRLVQRRGRQVHVAHRGAQVRVTGQLLDGLRRRSAHREMRAERVAEPMDVPGHRKATSAFRALHPATQSGLRHALAVAATLG